MPTYPSPITVSELQYYLRDTSSDPNLLAFYSSLLCVATDEAYHLLGLDFTAAAEQTITFDGCDQRRVRLGQNAAIILSWSILDSDNISTVGNPASLTLREAGAVLYNKEGFTTGSEHTVTYLLPNSTSAPDGVKQVILERAAEMFLQSKQGLGTIGELSASGSYNFSLTHPPVSPLSAEHTARLQQYKQFAI